MNRVDKNYYCMKLSEREEERRRGRKEERGKRGKKKEKEGWERTEKEGIDEGSLNCLNCFLGRG